MRGQIRALNHGVNQDLPRRQFANPKQPRKAFGVATLGLDPIAGLHRNQRWGSNDAAMVKALDEPLQILAGRACLPFRRTSGYDTC